jgi:hypothetical protein
MKRIFLIIASLLLFSAAMSAQVSKASVPHFGRRASAPNCTLKGQTYYDTVGFAYMVCTATGTPGTWSTLGGGGTGPATFIGTVGVPALTLRSGGTATSDYVFQYKNSSGTIEYQSYFDGNQTLVQQGLSGQFIFADGSNQAANFTTNTFSSTQATLTLSTLVSGKAGLNIALAASPTNNAIEVSSSGGTEADLFKVTQTGWVQGGVGAAVASAGAITPTGNTFHVTGTTNITSITSTGILSGTTITIIFDGVLTFTDGSNLKLAGNFVTTADDTISLRYDGTNWYEIGRSVN